MSILAARRQGGSNDTIEAPAGSNQWSVATWVQPPRFGTKEYCERAATVMNALKKVAEFRAHGSERTAWTTRSTTHTAVSPTP